MYKKKPTKKVCGGGRKPLEAPPHSPLALATTSKQRGGEALARAPLSVGAPHCGRGRTPQTRRTPPPLVIATPL